MSRGLTALLAQGKILPFSKSYQCPYISHISFADDMIIFTIGEKRSLVNLMEFLSLYEIEYGQLIYKAKSCYVVGKKTSLSRCQIIENVTGFQKRI